MISLHHSHILSISMYIHSLYCRFYKMNNRNFNKILIRRVSQARKEILEEEYLGKMAQMEQVHRDKLENQAFQGYQE